MVVMFDDLVRLETVLWNAVDARLRAETGTTLAHHELLRVVTDTGSCRVQDVARALAITVGGVSKLVDRVEAAGDLRRRAHPTDRRSMVLEPTRAGRDALSVSTCIVADELSRRLGDHLPHSDLARLAADLHLLRESQPEVAR